MSASPSELLQQHWVVAFSGGQDSAVLAQLMAELKQRGLVSQVTLMHIHHGLQAVADDWPEHCEQQSKELGLAFACEHVAVTTKPRQSIEALARNSRYAALREYCQKHNGILLLAHHLDDVLETFLLQLKRGAGPKGLAGMAEKNVIDNVCQLRPLLNTPQSVIANYAAYKKLQWIDDPSNNEQRFDRNFVRHTIAPLLASRWAGIHKAVARSAKLCAQQDGLIKQQAGHWLQSNINSDNTLPMQFLEAQPIDWQKEIVRHWCQQQTQSLPSHAQLETFFAALDSPLDKIPELQFAGFELRRFKYKLYLEPCNQATALVEQSIEPKPQSLALIAHALTLFISAASSDSGEENQIADQQSLFSCEISSDDDLSLMPAEPNTRLRVTQKGLDKQLKQWFKEWEVPPWHRQQSYLLCVNAQPAAVILPHKVVALYRDQALCTTANSPQLSLLIKQA